MASSGSFSGSIRNGGYTLRVDWSSSQSTESNTSAITCNMYLVQKAQYSLSIGSRSNTTTIDGSAIAYTSAAINNGGNTTVHLGTVTRTVSHNGDGSKSMYLSSVFNIQATLGGTWYESIEASSDLITLPTIPRSSSVSCPSSATAGGTLAISISRASDAFTHDLAYAIGSGITQIASGIGTSFSWVIPESLANYATGPNGAECQIICQTRQGLTSIGSDSAYFTLNVPNTPKFQPTVSIATPTDPTGYKTTYGAYVRGLSRIRVRTSAAGAYGSTITSYSVSVNGETGGSADYTSGIVKSNCPSTITVTVRDSRNRPASATVSGLTFLDYAPPSISGQSVKRVSSSAGTTDDDEGNYAKITFNYAVSPLGNKNSKTITLRYRTNDSSSYTTVETVTPSTYNGTYTKVVAASADNAYTYQITLGDDISSPAAYLDLPTAETVFDVLADGSGIAFGKVAGLAETLDVGWPLKPSGGITGNLLPSAHASLDIGASATSWRSLYALFGRFTSGLSVAGDAVAARWSGTTSKPGQYIKFYDGTMICYTYIYQTLNINQPKGSVYYRYAPSWNYPASFLSGTNPIAIASSICDDVMSVCCCGVYDTYIHSVLVQSAISLTNYQAAYGIVVIGRWK